jgi:hypothetical protein
VYSDKTLVGFRQVVQLPSLGFGAACLRNEAVGGELGRSERMPHGACFIVTVLSPWTSGRFEYLM